MDIEEKYVTKYLDKYGISDWIKRMDCFPLFGMWERHDKKEHRGVVEAGIRVFRNSDFQCLGMICLNGSYAGLLASQIGYSVGPDSPNIAWGIFPQQMKKCADAAEFEQVIEQELYEESEIINEHPSAARVMNDPRVPYNI